MSFWDSHVDDENNLVARIARDAVFAAHSSKGVFEPSRTHAVRPSPLPASLRDIHALAGPSPAAAWPARSCGYNGTTDRGATLLGLDDGERPLPLQSDAVCIPPASRHGAVDDCSVRHAPMIIDPDRLRSHFGSPALVHPLNTKWLRAPI